MLSLVFAAALAADPATVESAGLDEATPTVPGGPDAAPIINGDDADEDEFPQTGGMIMDMYLDMGEWGAGQVRTFVCSSTLIAPDVVLLAAHCIDEDAFTYGVGEMEVNEIRWSRQSDLSNWDGTSRAITWPDDSVVAIDWVKHDRFDLREMALGVDKNYDIALLFLEEPVLDTPFAYVPTVEEGDQLEEGAWVTVVGWGQQEATDTWDQPDPGTYALKQMGRAPLGEVGEWEFQVGPDEDDVRKCHGDSGGPTFTEIEADTAELLRVVGVTSHAFDGTDCNETGGVDTRVMGFRDWIEAEMVARCEDGTRSWCEVPGLPVAPPPSADPRASGPPGDETPAAACGCASVDPTAAPWMLGLAMLGLGVRRKR